MTNYGSFHGCNVPAHASKELCVRSHSEKRRQRVDFYSRRGTMAGLKVPGTVFVARIIPFGIRIGKSVDHPMEKEEIEGDRRGGEGEGREIARAIPRISFFPRRDFERENDFVHVHARTFFEITWIHDWIRDSSIILTRRFLQPLCSCV